MKKEIIYLEYIDVNNKHRKVTITEDRYVIDSDNADSNNRMKRNSMRNILQKLVEDFPKRVECDVLQNMLDEHYKGSETNQLLDTCLSDIRKSLNIRIPPGEKNDKKYENTARITKKDDMVILKGFTCCEHYLFQLKNVKKSKDVISYVDNYRPKHYIMPRQWLNESKDTAYNNNKRIFLISGEGGYGKTTLARNIAKECCQSNAVSKEGWKKRFKYVIFTDYVESFKATIEHLECYNPQFSTYEDKLSFLKEVNDDGPLLLVIDNWNDISDLYSETFQDFINNSEFMNCYILITSRNKSPNSPELHYISTINLSHLPIEDLVDLFISEAKNTSFTINEKENIKFLIEKHLNYNTFLTKSAGSIINRIKLDDFIAHFENYKIPNINIPIENEPLTNACERLFNLKELFYKSPILYKTLFLLSMIPLSGMKHKDFFNMGFKEEEIDEAEKDFNFLDSLHWANLSKDRNVSIHPIIKDFILSSIPFDYDYIKQYIQSLNRLVEKDWYNDTVFLNSFSSFISAWHIIDFLENKKGVIYTDINSSLLLANIASTYDIIRDKKKTWFYGNKAKKRLDLIFPDIEYGNEDLKKIARGYNAVGYDLLHCKNEKNYIYLAEESLTSCSKILKELEKNYISDKRLSTINQGNLAALFIKTKNYDKAKKLHEENIQDRLTFLKLCPNRPEYNRLVAAAFKGVGTCYYYLSKKEDNIHKKIDLLHQAIKNHLKARKYYKKSTQNINLDVIVSENRLFGSLIKLFEVYTQEKIRINKCEYDKLNKALRTSIQNLTLLLETDLLNQEEIGITLNNIKNAITYIEPNCTKDETIIEKYNYIKSIINNKEISKTIKLTTINEFNLLFDYLPSYKENSNNEISLR
ncbi:hypothetical protein [Faecalicoccus pleomorphus]|uniref:hypothetical protein n=1 Tax=Faecalicoccus pleomorphus TaxID=1323 RepID=UPI0039F50428